MGPVDPLRTPLRTPIVWHVSEDDEKGHVPEEEMEAFEALDEEDDDYPLGQSDCKKASPMPSLLDTVSTGQGITYRL